MTINKQRKSALWNNYCRNVDAWALIACAVAALFPLDVAAADAAKASLGDMICTVRQNITPFTGFFSALAYVCGAALGINGVMLLKKHADNPNDSQIVKASAHLVSAGALAALPAAAAVLQKSFFPKTSGGTMGCTAGEIPAAAVGLDEMMRNFVGNIYQPMFSMLAVLAFVMGAFFVYRGLIKSSKIGTDPRAAATHSIAANFVVGAVLMTIGGMFPVMLNTLFGSETITFSGINWDKITGGGVDTTNAKLTVIAILQFVQIIGAIAFIRGWLIIKNAVEGTGQATVPQGLTHVIGGTMALNIGQMLFLFDKTFGTGLINPS